MMRARMQRFLCLWMFPILRPTLLLLVINNTLGNVVGVEDGSDSISISPDSGIIIRSTEEHGKRQIEWIRSKGGFVHDAFEIRRSNPSDPTSRYGVFAKTDLAKSEVILVIPRSCLITGETDDEEEESDDYICDAVFHLAREMKLGENSKFEPYVTYLNSQAYGQIPAMWSKEGKTLMKKVLGWDEEYQEFLLPPVGALLGGHGCKTKTLFEKNAEMLVRQRSWDDILIPVWDMVSHRNGRWLNVEEKYSVHNPKYNVTVHAIRDIKAGEEIYMSYSHCVDCGNRFTGYGTAEIMRDYGFVESFPQKWVFDDQQTVIELDYPYHEDGSIISEDDSALILTWLPESGEPDDDDLDFFEDQIERLKEIDFGNRPPSVPEHEWDVTVAYHHAILRAMERIVADAQTSSTEDGWQPLHGAVLAGNLEAVQYLVETARVDINARTGPYRDGDSPLHLAYRHLTADHEVTQFLLSHGAVDYGSEEDL